MGVFMVLNTSVGIWIANVSYAGYFSFYRNGTDGFVLVNRFAGSRLEDLIPEIPGMCKDQHGCRFLQKKLEEGIPEHRDVIFRETFSHFADLMTGTEVPD